MLTFNTLGFSPELQKGIDALGFEKPTPIQEKIIPLVLETQNDIIGLAQTGTGKTAAFGLPILEQTDIDFNKIQALILAPTRELCVQIGNDIHNFGKHIKGLRIITVYGGASIQNQIKDLNRGGHIIVATPGRLLDLIKRKKADIGQVQTVVLDEADEMLNMGFREDLEAILTNAPEERRTLLFSATMSKEVERIAHKFMHKPEQVVAGKKNTGAANVRHIYYQVHAKNRYNALKRIIDFHPAIYGIVFCRTRAETKDVADKLMRDGYHADALHGDLSQAQRDYVMNRFRERSLQVLVATDVAARGIDVQDITHVINYNLPEAIESYTHRSGRTGRAEKSGVCISIVNYREVSVIPAIERIIGKKMEKQNVPDGKDICQKQLFNFIDKMENVEIDEDEIAPFMEAVNKKLEWLDKEQIIKHFLSLEFNRFLEYYKGAGDINSNEKVEPREGRGKRQRGGRSRGENRNYARFFINVGRKDKISPANIIGLINDNTNDRDISIGDIDIKDSFSFFETDEASRDKVMRSFKNAKYNGRSVRVENAEPVKGGGNGSNGGNKGRKKKKRA